MLLLAAPHQPLLLPARIPVVAERPTYSASEAPKASEVQATPTKSYKVYAKAPNGEVFVRSSNKSYPFASVWVGNDGKSAIKSWHSRQDLAQRACKVHSSGRYIAVPTTRQNPGGTCGHCHGGKMVRCSKCHGKYEGDTISSTYVEQEGSKFLKRIDTVTGHWVCNCDHGKRKCHVCGGKGEFKAVAK